MDGSWEEWAKSEASGELGQVRLSPDRPIVAGEVGTWRITYTAGSRGIAAGGGLRLGTDTDTDWGHPQVEDPAAPEYVTVQAPEGMVPLIIAHRITALQVRLGGRDLEPGEEVTITIGDTSGGGPGSRAQTTYEEQHFFVLSVSPGPEAPWVALESRPCVPVVGADAVALDVVAPSTVAVGEPFRLLMRARDAFGNPSSTFRGAVRLSLPGAEWEEHTVEFGPDSGGIVLLEGLRLGGEGIWRVAAEEINGELACLSNPVRCLKQVDGPRLYWGEPHGGQLHMADKIAGFFRYARDISGLDFCGYQANDHRLSAEEWATQQRAEVDAYEPGRFVPMPGFEWSAEPREGGHHNVYFRRFHQPIRRSCHLDVIADEGDQETDLTHATALHEAYRGTDTLITPHVGGGRADLTWHDPSLEPGLEITSNHGTFEWFLRDALERRHRMAFLGGSDGYTGRPGGEYPGYVERRYAKGGYTGLYASELTVDGVWQGLKSRRAYATTGARILADVEACGVPMGAEMTTHVKPTISALIAGTAPLEAIELYRGLDRLYELPIDLERRRGVLRVTWDGASRRTSYSAVIWDGELTVADRRIAEARTMRFDGPRCSVDVSDEGVSWHSVSCGYRSGLILPLNEGPENATVDLVLRMTLTTMSAFGGWGDDAPKRVSYTPMETVRLSVSLSDLDAGPVRLDLGELNRTLVLDWAPGTAMLDARFQWTDPDPRPGVNPYWLRVIQQDGEMAWTSPVFVDYIA